MSGAKSEADSGRAGVERLVLSFRGWIHLFNLVLVIFAVFMTCIPFFDPEMNLTAQVLLALGLGLFCGFFCCSRAL